MKFGHATPFRRTITLGKERETLLFDPDTPYDLSPDEVAGLAAEIDCGLIVPWDTDDKGRRARPPRGPLAPDESELAERVRRLEAENASLRAQLESLEAIGGGRDDETDLEEINPEAGPAGDSEEPPADDSSS
ncbi:MAG: hypothetical protein KY476_24605 [Planctomycetes bacterium]|nr:hypothetical protein [Planctomycetota bacterium]